MGPAKKIEVMPAITSIDNDIKLKMTAFGTLKGTRTFTLSFINLLTIILGKWYTKSLQIRNILTTKY